MFLIRGVLYTHGTADSPVVFDGSSNSNFFGAKGCDQNALLDLDYCEIRNGISFWPDTYPGAFSIRHSQLTNLSAASYVWFPEMDIHIETNTFSNAAGFTTLHAGDTKVYIQYNHFNTKNPNLAESDRFWIKSMGSFNDSQTIVKYNSFNPAAAGIALKLSGNKEIASISATENYWGTEDTDIIDSMIFDRADDISCENFIDYEPILTSPKPEPETDH